MSLFFVNSLGPTRALATPTELYGHLRTKYAEGDQITHKDLHAFVADYIKRHYSQGDPDFVIRSLVQYGALAYDEKRKKYQVRPFGASGGS